MPVWRRVGGDAYVAVAASEDERPAVRWPLVVFVIPLFLAAVGLALRYLAFRWAGGDAAAGFEAFATSQCRWDCSWYIGIAERGYDGFPVPDRGNVGNWAFFPLYPLLVGLILPLAALPTIAIATVTSSLATMATCLIGWPLLDRNIRAYLLFSTFLLAGPFSVYFSTFLTESLFILLTCAVLLALKQRAWLAAGFLSTALSATRIVGVFIVFATVIAMLRDHLRAGGRIISFPRHVLARPDLLLAIFVSPLGLFAYMLFLYLTMGDGLAFNHVQRAFGRMFGDPFTFMAIALSDTPREGWWPTARQMGGIAALVGLGLTGLLVVRRRFAEAAFCAVCVIIPIAGGLFSMTRYMAGLAPLVLVAAAETGRSRIAAAIASVAMIAACPFTTLAWMEAHLALV